MKYLRVRKHEEFQHYKDRTPPWIKLHRCCLSSYRFTDLSDSAKWHALGIALLATETNNHIPNDTKWIARHIAARTVVRLEPLIASEFLVWCDCERCASADASTSASGRCSTPRKQKEEKEEGEADKRKKENTCASDFERFWAAYPKRKGKGRARDRFSKLRDNGLPPIEELVAIVFAWCRTGDWIKEGGKYIPYPAKWLNEEGWSDELPATAAPEENERSPEQTAAWRRRNGWTEADIAAEEAGS